VPQLRERKRRRYRVLLISGSLRKGSTNTALLRTAQLLAPEETDAVLFEGLGGLPHFDPDLDRDPLPPEVDEMRSAVRQAAAILFCTPEYAGDMPGSLKNLLEWAIGDGEPGSIYEKPVAWANASTGPTGAADAHESLRKVLGYAHANLVEEACVVVPVGRSDVDGDGFVTDEDVRSSIVSALRSLIGAVES
jgi:chromate reductase, NAD(P)H dehydrogenase (quinone)